MPRIPGAHREPKPPPRRRSRSQQSPHRNGNHTSPLPENEADYDIPAPEPKKKLTSLQAHLVAASGEFVGTFMFLFFSFAGTLMIVNQASDQATSNGQASSQQNIFIALLYGFSLLVNVWAFFRISGGLFNPAVTLGMLTSGQLPLLRSLFLIPAQFLAAISAAALVSCIFPGDIALTNTTLSPSTSITQGLFIETFMTAELVFVVLMLAAEKSRATFMAPVGIGLALFVAMMGGVYYTGGSLNPARSFGPAVASVTFVGYHWIYWLGPVLGALMAAAYYRFVKHFNYELVNPGQDSSGGGEGDGEV